MNEILKKRIEKASAYVTEELSNGAFKDACIHNFEAGARFALTHQWISVEEALPDYDEIVLVTTGDNEYFFCHRSNYSIVKTDKNKWCNYSGKDIVAWMPIPKFNGKEV